MPATTTSAKPGRRSRFASVAQRRYVDAYRVANTISWFGQAIKVGGGILGVFIFAGVSEAMKSPGGGLIIGIMVGAVFFVIGVMVAAQGQLLRATLDTAVHSSPFLTDDLRATVMSLRPNGRASLVEPSDSGTDVSDADDGADVAVDSTADRSTESAPFCYHCGSEVGAGATKCPACGKVL
ncbi:MAG: zinc ribbon domain-containing protein [Acidobacteria bacterium]|nr:zinc ribbon domain-containing protein [Acidobacteriota bacterium]